LGVTAFVVVILVVVSLVTRARQPNAEQATPPSAKPTSSGAIPSETGQTPAPTPPVVVTEAGHPLLNTSSSWDLFARGSGVLVRIELARGRATRTPVPELSSGGPVSFVVAAGRALIRPLDYVPGYLVRNGVGTTELSGPLGQGGPAFAGPRPGQVWVQSGSDGATRMSLVGLDEQSTSISFPLPTDQTSVVSDGAGYVLFTAIGGAYDARPGSIRRVTSGEIVAFGPTKWLTVECDDQHRCATVATDRRTGARRVIGPAVSTYTPRGVISPNGATAALYNVGPTGKITLQLLDLVSGGQRPVAVSINQSVDEGTLVWAPDGSWLFAVGDAGQIVVINPRTATIRSLGMPLPQVSQLTIDRDASADTSQ
jgi:hypothetical protein